MATLPGVPLRSAPALLLLLLLAPAVVLSASSQVCMQEDADCMGAPPVHSLDFKGATALLRGGQLAFVTLAGEVPLSTLEGLFDLLTLQTDAKVLFSEAYLDATQECAFAQASDLLEIDQQVLEKRRAVTRVGVPVFEPLRLVVRCEHDADITLYTKELQQANLVFAAAGLFLMLLAGPLSRSAVFFYFSGTGLGVLIVLFIALLFVGREGTRRIGFLWAGLGMLASSFMTYFNTKHLFQGQGLTFVELCQRIWSQEAEYFYIFWGLAGVAFVSFIVTFWRGPPAERTKTTLELVLTLVGAFLFFVGLREDARLATGVTAVLLTALHIKLPRWARYVLFPLYLLKTIVKGLYRIGTWPIRKLFFAQKPRALLSQEEYDAVGEEYTKRSLELLRAQYLDSPAKEQNRLVSGMQEPPLFLDFVNNEGDHLKPGTWREWLAACVDSEDEVAFSSEEEEEEDETTFARQSFVARTPSTPQMDRQRRGSTLRQQQPQSQVRRHHTFFSYSPQVPQMQRSPMPAAPPPPPRPVTPPFDLEEEEEGAEETLMYPEHVDSLSDAQLRQGLEHFGFPVGPIVDASRVLLRNRLKNALANLN